MKLHLLNPTFIREDERGLFVEAINGTVWENVSYGIMKSGAVMGNHYHKQTDVFFYIIKGEAKVDIVDVETKEIGSAILSKNEGIYLERNFSHAIRFKEETIFIMGKSKKYDSHNADTFSLIIPERL